MFVHNSYSHKLSEDTLPIYLRFSREKSKIDFRFYEGVLAMGIENIIFLLSSSLSFKHVVFVKLTEFRTFFKIMFRVFIIKTSMSSSIMRTAIKRYQITVEIKQAWVRMSNIQFSLSDFFIEFGRCFYSSTGDFFLTLRPPSSFLRLFVTDKPPPLGGLQASNEAQIKPNFS